MYLALGLLFPVLLIGFQMLVNIAFSQDILGFIGPTLAASALALVVSMIRPKRLVQSEIAGVDSVVMSKADHVISVLSIISAFVLLLVWLWTVFLSIWGTLLSTPIIKEAHIILGGGCYIAACIMASFREKI